MNQNITELGVSCFKPYYKWIIFNILDNTLWGGVIGV